MVNEISAEKPDWSREIPEKYWDPGRRLLRTIRNYQALSINKSSLINRIKKILGF